MSRHLWSNILRNVQQGLIVQVWITENDYASIRSFLDQLSLVERHAIVSTRRSDETSMLHYASYHGQLETVKYFVIDCVANVNVVYRRTGLSTIPLFIAISRGDYLMVRLLVKLGANLLWQNLFAENALVYACKHQQLRMALYLSQIGCRLNTDRNIRLCSQCLKYCVSSIMLGTSINETDSKHDSIFILAAEIGNLEVLTLLLHLGVDIHYTNRSLDNALSAALWRNQIRTYQYFLKSRLYTKIDRALAFELCGAKMILFQSRYDEALDMWVKSIKLRLKVLDGISTKFNYYYKNYIRPIKEFRSVPDISRMRGDKEACIEQAHLVYTRIRDIPL